MHSEELHRTEIVLCHFVRSHKMTEHLRILTLVFAKNLFCDLFYILGSRF